MDEEEEEEEQQQQHHHQQQQQQQRQQHYSIFNEGRHEHFFQGMNGKLCTFRSVVESN